MRVAYLDCIGGISGDMLLGALIDAGVDPDQLVAGLRTLQLPNWELRVRRVEKSGIDATKVDVVVGGVDAGDAPLLRLPPSDAPRAEHTHTHQHPHEHGRSHSHAHTHEHSHENEPGREHEHHSHGHKAHSHEAHSHGGHSHSHDEHGERTFSDVAALIRNSGLPEPVKQQAEAVYRRLGEAEARVHGVTLETIHFHEVGAVDSIIDVVGSVYGLYLLDIDRILCSPLPNGSGFVRCAHGLMPIPTPATAELLKGCPLRPVDIQGELVTPTGAALAGTLTESFGPVPGFTIRQVGYGAGLKDFPFPNLLRVIIGDDATAPQEATHVTLIEANIDDQSPQLYEEAMSALFAAGALDVWLTPIVMKKSRPAHTLHVLCEPGDLDRITDVLFAETSTFGVRFGRWERRCLQREWAEVETPYGTVRVKIGRQNGALRTATPEYEDCRERAQAAGVPVKAVQAAAVAAAFHLLKA